MKKIIVFFIFFALLILSYLYKNIKYEKIDIVEKDIVVNKDEYKDTTIKIKYNDIIQDIYLEDYVVGVVACEMPSSFNYEALKSMAVAARTFALYKINTNKNYVMKTTVSDQCYYSIEKLKEKWGSSFDDNYLKIKNAVNDTRGQYMTYEDEVIIAFYFSISNGYTENCENVFSQQLDYLVSVDSSWDKDYQYKESTNKVLVSDFLSKLGLADKNINKISIDRSNTNRINYITINGKKFKGSKFRNLLSLRSTDIEITHDNKYVYIKTKGYGHGVGMSQYGAHTMGKNGYSYDEILKHYYNGIEIVNKI